MLLPNVDNILAASRRGASHIRNNTPCQDAYALETQTISYKTAIALVHCQGCFVWLLFSAKALALLPLKGENILAWGIAPGLDV